MITSEQIAAQIKSATAQLAALENEHQGLLVKLVESNDAAATANIEQQRAQVGSEIRACRDKLAGLNKLALEAAAQDGDEAKRNAFKETQAIYKRVANKRTAACEVAADALIKAIDSLTLPIAQWQAAQEGLAADANAVLRRTNPRGLPHEVTAKIADRVHLHDGRITEALARALCSTGLGRTGPSFGEFLTIAEPSVISQKVALVDAVKHSNQRLIDTLSDHVQRAASEFATTKDQTKDQK